MTSDQDRLSALETKVNEHTDRLQAVDHRVAALEHVSPSGPSLPKRALTWITGHVVAIAIFLSGVGTTTALVGVGLATSFIAVPGCPGSEPVPPTPTPTPIPVPPNPPTPPAPIPLPGFRVLIVYDKDTLTDAQQGIVYGAAVRKYLDTKCVTGEDGKTPDRRIYAAGVDASGEARWIQDAIQRHPGQKSWMVVSDGKTGYDGPLPANADEAMKILTKIGG